ncbi:putative tetratricopeptide-like helical domain superfamily [Helianthus annuus]|uniref:Tetratricopeptide-like helical domain superfamily n=1 Tax=Helianthus annuus TaxID=4232 RepID=A0A9K3NAF7_HELAN|nr:putative tetratricopeptide-like helical domain superfamily [Helianthus annuus]KAJ0527360.1 hypothetical protein HanHA300_Chr09g0333171 [Helianthus annuus]KAJ0543762.1 hypothetical protein HanHA89_Chr09g0354151 [Helianthus annuus]KAJ0708816.1 hypothetical protein HanLR1_Chr09g0333461 [Helianthus annuus]KAJ0889889.1 putative tetratricopeptide-like helical domain superfamily [Helianthus annuus]
MLAQALFLGLHYRRAFHLLSASQIVLSDLRFCYLSHQYHSSCPNLYHLLALICLNNHLNNSKVPFQTPKHVFLNPFFFKQDLDFFFLIIFISSSSLELLRSQILHCVTFWCVNPPILLTTAIINGSIYVYVDFVVLMFQF